MDDSQNRQGLKAWISSNMANQQHEPLKKDRTAERSAGVVVLRITDHIGNGANFDHLPVIHNRNAVAEGADNGKA